MRQYFDKDKHINSIWFDPAVNQENVLQYIGEASNNFPLTPVKIVDMFNCIQSFKKNLKKTEVFLSKNGAVLYQKPKKKIENIPTSKYQTGEVTLKEIGETLGGLTPTMINKITYSGMDKFKKMLNGIPFEEMRNEEYAKLNKFIMDCRTSAAVEYSNDLKNSKGNVKTFINNLMKKHVLSSNDVKLMEDKEVEALTMISMKSQGEITQILLADILNENNVFKSYQSLVSKKAFPNKKRGRPRKDAAAKEN